MTGVASTSTTCIVRPGAAFKGGRGMTGMAIQRGVDVGRIGLGFFTNRYRTIMARFAIILDTGMVVSCADERSGGMADTTVLVRW